MKVRLTDDEWYPVLTPERREDWMTDEYWGTNATEVPDEVVERWEAAAEAFHAACAELRKYEEVPEHYIFIDTTVESK